MKPPNPRRRNARLIFFYFTLTFIASRVLVILIMLRRLPDLFLHLGGTHVHHLNYGIFLLAAIGAVLLFASPSERQKQWLSRTYGVAMALTFDEFGMWLHLGGGYWQRASYDALILLSALLGLIAYAPRWARVGPRQHLAMAITVAAVAVFCWLSFQSLNYVERTMGKKLRSIEELGPQ